MNKLIISALCAVAALSASAQQKLPAKVTLTFTDKQVLRIDSAINMAGNQIDSKSFTSWFLGSFAPFYQQVTKQMVSDTVKKKP